jgi:signal transduction histidine kinase
MQGEMLYFESVSFLEIQDSFVHYEPNIKWIFECDKNLKIYIDKKAFESILKNLVENSKRHGKANQIQIECKKLESQYIIIVTDDGDGFKGQFSNLGQPFIRHSKTSGTGIGLFIVKKLIGKMKGQVEWSNLKKGFMVKMSFGDS